MLEVTLSGVCLVRTLQPFLRRAHGSDGDQGSSCVSAFAQRDGPEARKGGRVTVE